MKTKQTCRYVWCCSDTSCAFVEVLLMVCANNTDSVMHLFEITRQDKQWHWSGWTVKGKEFLITYSRLSKRTVNNMPVQHRPAVTEFPLTKHCINVIYKQLWQTIKKRNQSISAMMSLRMNLMKKTTYTALQQLTQNSSLNWRKCNYYYKQSANFKYATTIQFVVTCK